MLLGRRNKLLHLLVWIICRRPKPIKTTILKTKQCINGKYELDAVNGARKKISNNWEFYAVYTMSSLHFHKSQQLRILFKKWKGSIAVIGVGGGGKWLLTCVQQQRLEVVAIVASVFSISCPSMICPATPKARKLKRSRNYNFKQRITELYNSSA